MTTKTERVLKKIAKKTGLSVKEIEKKSWDEIEELLGLSKIDIDSDVDGHILIEGLQKIVTEEDNERDEKVVIDFLNSTKKQNVSNG